MAKKNKPDPPKCYIDACIFLSYIEETADRIKAIDCLFGECENKERSGHSCHLSIAEVAFAKWEKEKSVLEPDVEAKIDALWHPQSPFLLAEVSEAIVREAKSLIRTAVQHGWALRAHDAIHFAVAKKVGATEFFTYDEKLNKFDAVLGYKILPPYESPNIFNLPPVQPPT
jgi:predicted nucleic acid-binding protein